MRRFAICIALLALCAGGAQAAWTPDVASWDYYWDFDNGLQGWTLGGSAAAMWVDPAVDPNGPMLPDNDVSEAGAGNLYLPDNGYAQIDVSSLMLGNGEGKKGFQLWAQVYIPNLRPLAGFTNGYPGNMNHRAGVAALRAGDNKPIYVGGRIESGQVRAMDKTWDNTSRGPSWTMESTASPDGLWWDQWITLVFDYNYNTPGKWNAAAYIPWDGPVHTAGWITLAENIECNANVQFDKLRIGAVNDGDSWTQSQFDDVYLKVVPEPGSFIVLGTGLVGLLGAIRRRK